MNKILKINIITGLVILFFFNSCVKEDFDNTPEYVTNLVANTTIKDLKSLYTGSAVLIDTSIIIKGIVVSNDKYGNFYKELFIEDETGAVSIRLDNSYLYEHYPVGKLVYVKCEGLYLGTYNGVYQIGLGANVDRINDGLIENYLDISAGGTPVVPKTVTLEDLTGNNADSLLGSFIKIENVQFVDTSLNYVEGTFSYTTSNIQDCSGNTVVLSTSKFADFKNDHLPKGNGTIKAVLSKFNNDYQLRINSTDDVNFTGNRCTK